MGFYNKKEKILKPYIGKHGYYRITFDKKTILLHRLIAMTFIPNPQNKEQVNHKDGNKLNNHIDNLEWASRLENMKHALDNGLIVANPQHQILITNKAREVNLKAILKFSKDNIFIEEYSSIIEGAKANNLPQSNISMCCNGKLKSCGGFIWKFK